MTEQAVTLQSLQGQGLDEFLQRIADQQTVVTVRLPDGREVVIESKRRLQPLPALKGTIPCGWKDAIYARG